MTNPSHKSASPAETPHDPKRSPRFWVRLTVVTVVLVLTLAALAIGVPWGFYRYQHIVLRKAVVNGTVAQLGARIEGRIKAIEVEPGQSVSRGDVLVRLEDSHLQAALDQARAELQQRTQELEVEKLAIERTRRTLKHDLERADGMRQSATAKLNAEQCNLERLEKDYIRIAALIDDEIAAPTELDHVKGDRDQSRALVQAAQGLVEAAESSYQTAANELDGLRVREANLNVLLSQVTIARAKVANAQAQVDATLLRAPENGQVVERIVELGGSARVGEPMISLRIGRPWIEAWVDERLLGEIRVGSVAEISLDALPQFNLSGRVEAIGLVSDKHLDPSPVPSTLHTLVRKNAMVPVRIAIDGDISQIPLGLSAVVGIRRESEKERTEGSTMLNRLRLWKTTAKR